MQQPDECRERHQRAEDDEIRERQHRCGRERVGTECAQLARGGTREAEARAARQHLHAGRDEGLPGQGRRAGVDRSRCPRPRRAQAGEGPEQVDTARLGAAEQHGDAGEAEAEPDDGTTREAPAEQQPLQQGNPEREHGDEERRHARGDAALRPYDGAVPAQEECRAHDGGGTPLRQADGLRAPVAARCGEGGEEGAGDQETHRGRREGRQGVDRHADGEIGRAPDHVHDGERAPDARR